MAFALNIPVIPVVSLLAVAVRDHKAATAPASLSVVVQDARMGEVYLAAYLADADAASGWRELQDPVLLNAEYVGRWLQQAVSGWQAVYGELSVRLSGDALLAYPALSQVQAGCVRVELGAPLRPDAETVARLALIGWHTGGGIAPELAAPLYVRNKVAYTTLERQQGQGGNPKAPEPGSVAILDMAAEHLDDVADIERSVQSFPWTRGNFADGLQAGYGAWVARQSGRVVGFCMAMFAPDVAHVLVIAVAPSSQKKGIGALLLRHCENAARLRGLPALMLEVRPSNGNALNFYQRHGFKQLAIRKDYYPAGDGQREDACVMEKTLGAT